MDQPFIAFPLEDRRQRERDLAGLESALGGLKNSGEPPITQPDERVGDATVEAPAARFAGRSI